ERTRAQIGFFAAAGSTARRITKARSRVSRAGSVEHREYAWENAIGLAEASTDVASLAPAGPGPTCVSTVRKTSYESAFGPTCVVPQSKYRLSGVLPSRCRILNPAFPMTYVFASIVFSGMPSES